VFRSVPLAFRDPSSRSKKSKPIEEQMKSITAPHRYITRLKNKTFRAQPRNTRTKKSLLLTRLGARTPVVAPVVQLLPAPLPSVPEITLVPFRSKKP
jgi:hypothetical protein